MSVIFLAYVITCATTHMVDITVLVLLGTDWLMDMDVRVSEN